MSAASAAGASADEDRLLVQQAAAGDMRAFSQLAVKYQDRLVNLCWRLCGHWEDAEDLAQEVFLRALRAVGGFEQRSAFYTWLYRIAVNLSLSQRRRRARQPRLTLLEGDSLGEVEHQAIRLVGRGSSEDQPVGERLSARETERQVIEAIETLDDEHRSVVVLRDIEGLNYQQIAEVLECPVGTVKSRLSRARMELRERLRPLFGDPQADDSGNPVRRGRDQA